MKIIALITILFSSLFCISQNEKSKISPYISLGLSISNGNSFKDNSYPSIEIGGYKNNLSVGAIFGRGSLNGLGEKTDHIENYFFEIKPSVSKSITEKISAYSVTGIGSYCASNHIFIEYGLGLTYSIKKISLFMQASNWDNVWYVSQGITLNF